MSAEAAALSLLLPAAPVLDARALAYSNDTSDVSTNMEQRIWDVFPLGEIVYPFGQLVTEL